MTKLMIAGGVVLLLAVLPTAASAHTAIVAPADSPFPYQRWIDESQVPTPEVTIEVIGTSAGHGCPSRQLDYMACTSSTEHKIWMDEAEVTFGAREDFMHEIGHNFDADDMTESDRARFDAIYGFGGPWLLAVEPEQMTAGEWFAEIYSECSAIAHITRRRERANGPGPVYGRPPLFNRRQAHNRACRLIAAAA